MAKKVRNYREEYRRRIARAQAWGLSRSQARGHPRPGEKGIRAKPKSSLEDARIHQGLVGMRKGHSLAAAARSAGISSERLRQFVTEHKVGRKRRRRWQLIPSRLKWQWEVFSEGRLVSVVVGDPETSSLLAKYLNAVRRLLRHNDPTALRAFRNVSFRDVSRQRYVLETRPNVIFRLAHAERESPEDFYKLVV